MESHAPAQSAHGSGGNHDEQSNLIANILGIVGLILLAIIVIWGLFHLASLFGGSGAKSSSNAITVTAPANVNAGEPLTISWKYSPKEKGAYALLYQCKDALQLTYPSSGTHIQIPCGAAFTLGTATSSTTVLPLLGSTSTLSVPVTIIYIPNTASSNAAPIQGSVSVAVHPAHGGQVVTTTKPATTKKPTGSTSAPRPSTPADISVRIISLTVDAYGNGTATFDIANTGGSASASYTFQAQLPTTQPYTYTSPVQAPLSAGSHIENTLHFSQATGGLFSVIVTGGDSTPGNNSASQYMTGTYYRAY